VIRSILALGLLLQAPSTTGGVAVDLDSRSAVISATVGRDLDSTGLSCTARLISCAPPTCTSFEPACGVVAWERQCAELIKGKC
jgi:hypothetical protein